MAKRDAFTDELDEFVTQAEAFATYGELDRMAENVQKLSDLEAKMADARTRAEALSSEEELLGFPRSQFPQLEEVPKTLAPYKALWSTAQDFSKNSYQWLNGPMTAIDPEVVEGEAKALWKANFKTIKTFNEMAPDDASDQTPPLKVAEALKLKIDEFQEKLPLISAMCNKGLRERHWESISEVIGCPFNLSTCRKLGSTLPRGPSDLSLPDPSFPP